MADELIQGGGAATDSGATGGASAPVVATTPETDGGAATGGQATSGAMTGQGSGGAGQAASLAGLREYGRKYGLDPAQFADETVLAEQLFHVARQYAGLQGMEPVLQQYQQHRGEFERWLAGRQQAQQPQAPEKPKGLFDRRPEFDQRWWGLVERDPVTGRLRAKAGASPDLGQKAESYLGWLQEWQSALAERPEEALGGLIEQKVRQLVGQQVGAIQDDQTANQLLAQADGWLFEKDGTGGFRRDAQGARQLSPAGRLYAQHVQEIARMGVRDVRMQHQYAMKMVQAAVAMAGGQRQQQTAPAAAGQAAFIAQQAASRTPNVAGAAAAPAVDQGTRGLSLRESLARRLKEAGITDIDMAG